MANLAIIESAPAGTERRPYPQETWVTAAVNDTLNDNDAMRNTQSQDYQVRLREMAMLALESQDMVTLSDLEGTVRYRTDGGDWTEVTVEGDYSVIAVGTEEQSGVSVTCGASLFIKPPPWKQIP